MKKSVYIETSVISYLTARPSRDLVSASRQTITQDWWESQKPKFSIYISALVATEAKHGDELAAQKRLPALEDIPAITIATEARDIADKLMHDGPMPEEYPEDALHIAICALNGLDYLLTWNFTHLANATIRRQVEQCLDDAGYQCPIICTPEELMGGA